MKLYNTIFLREFEKCDYNILALWYKKNKVIIEENFYTYDILMSGTIKEFAGNGLEILYLKYFSEKEINIEDAMNIYSARTKEFPKYEEYVASCRLRSEIDIINKIIRKMIPEYEYILVDSKEFNSRCLLIESMLTNPFTCSIKPKKVIASKSGKAELECVKEKELSFIGIASDILIDSFEKMLCYKILEKVFGSNDNYGVYYRFRERGWIYTGLAGYIVDNSFFYSGVLMQYNRNHEEEIMLYIENLSFSDAEFERAKKHILDDYKYSVLQYGEEFTMLPYKLHVKCRDTFENKLNQITLECVKEELHYLHVHGRTIRMKVI